MTRTLVVVVTAATLSAAVLNSGLHQALQAQVTGALTVGGAIGMARGLVGEIDDRASNLLHQGNSVAAQQQTLLAGLLRGAIEQLEMAYADRMNETVDRLMGAEKDVFTHLQLALEQVDQTATGTVDEVSKAIRQTHAATTEVLSRVPFTDKYPVIHGLVTRDLLTDLSQPDEIQILGFFLVDPDLNELPEVWVNGEQVTDGVSAYFDRLHVQLPTSLKDRLNLANTACEPRRTFSVWVRVAYHRQRGIWPVRWKQRATFERNMIAAPGDVQYEVTLSKSGVTTTTGTVNESFRVESPNFNWSCEDNRTQHADFTVPHGHTLVEKQAGWAELGGRWENHHCSVSDTGGRVVGACSVRGANKSWGQCDGGGHGRVAVWGTTSKQVAVTTPFERELVRQSVMRGNERNDTIDLGPGQSVSSVVVEMRRLNASGRCSAPADSAVIALDPALTTTRRATSANGMFEVITDGRQVSVRRR